jgi:hypothetical protein
MILVLLDSPVFWQKPHFSKMVSGFILKNQNRRVLLNGAWYAEFLLEIDLNILLRKTGARLNFKMALISLHIHPGHKSNGFDNSVD